MAVQFANLFLRSAPSARLANGRNRNLSEWMVSPVLFASRVGLSRISRTFLTAALVGCSLFAE